MFGDVKAFHSEPLVENVVEMFIGPFGSSLKNESFVPQEQGYCMVYEQKHAIKKSLAVETRYVTESKYEELKRFEIHPGDIIVSCRGTIGETFIIPADAPCGIMHPSIMKIRVKSTKYLPIFFNMLLQASLGRHNQDANGSGVKMAITATELGSELFIVPPLPLQTAFAAFVERLDKSEFYERKALLRLNEVRQMCMINPF